MRVLVADDDPLYRHLLRSSLEASDFEPVVVEDGEQAWRELEVADPPRLLILDWNMPTLDGIEICRRVRARDDVENYSYVLLLTGRNSKVDTLAALNAGVDDFMTKPFQRDEVMARIKVGLRLVTLHQRLASAAAETRAVVECVPFGIACVDQHGVVTSHNTQFLRLLQIESPSFCGQSLAKLAAPGDSNLPELLRAARTLKPLDEFQIVFQLGEDSQAAFMLWGRPLGGNASWSKRYQITCWPA